MLTRGVILGCAISSAGIADEVNTSERANITRCKEMLWQQRLPFIAARGELKVQQTLTTKLLLPYVCFFTLLEEQQLVLCIAAKTYCYRITFKLNET